MDNISAVFLTILVVASLSISVQSFPEGCVKMIGSSSEGKPGEFFVKVNPNIRTATVVKIMLELSNSGCEGKLWRSSNTSDAVMEPMTCSDMLFMEGYGFFAKMSNAAAMWVCENDAVDNLEPNYAIITPPTPIDEPDPGATEGPATDGGSGSGNIVVSTSSIVMPDEDDSSGSGMSVVLPVTTSPSTCTKLYGELLPVNNYLVVFSYNSLDVNMENLYKLMQDVKKVDPNFDTAKIKPMVQGSKRGFYYNGLSKDAVMKLCESDLVEYIKVVKETSTTATPQPTGTSMPTSMPTPATTKCDKIAKYQDERETINYRYIVVFYENTSSSYIQVFIKDLMNQSSKPNSTMKAKNMQPLLNLKMFTAEMNMKAMEFVCESPKVKLIERDVVIPPPPKPEESTPTTSTTTPTTITTATTTTTPTTTTTATKPTTVTEASTTSTLKCSKLRGREVNPKELNHCRIYLKKDRTKAECRRFVMKMRAMDSDPGSGIQFEDDHVTHHKERPMIEAKLNAKAIDTVCQSNDTDMIFIRI